MTDIYRKSNLEKLSSPEQLDRMIVVTSPMFWLAMVGAGIIIAAALIWSVTARLPVTLSGEGLYLGSAAEQDGTVVCYLPLADAKKITVGMTVLVYPSTDSDQEYGHMEATVLSVDDYVTSEDDMLATLKDDSLVDYFASSAPVLAITCQLRADTSTASGFYWSSKKAANLTLAGGTLVTVKIVTEQKAPITLLLPMLAQS